MRRTVGGLVAGSGSVKTVTRGAKTTTVPTKLCSRRKGRTAQRVAPMDTRAMPTQSATTTRLPSMSLPLEAVRSHESPISRIGHPTHTAMIITLANRRTSLL
jgi:hypothetical protein